jgi:hypothetical protein
MWNFYLYTPAKTSHDVVLIVRVISFLKNGARTKHFYCSKSVKLVASSRLRPDYVSRKQKLQTSSFIIGLLSIFFCGAAAQIVSRPPH